MGNWSEYLSEQIEYPCPLQMEEEQHAAEEDKHLPQADEGVSEISAKKSQNIQVWENERCTEKKLSPCLLEPVL